MVTVTCSTTVADGITLVTARVEGAPVRRRVRLANRLDGPIWPPRRQGVPEAGWDDDGYTGLVPADGTLVVGYASPAPPADRPVALVDSEPVDEDASGASRGTDARDAGRAARADPIGPATDSTAAVRLLGDPSPPRDAVPLPDATTDAGRSAAEGPSAVQRGGATDPTPGGSPPGDTKTTPGRRPTPATDPSPPPNAVPEPVREWLAAVEERAATGERLASAEAVPAATDAIEDAGGLAGAERLAERLDEDADALALVAERTAALADRTADVDVPLDAFRELA